MKKLIFALLVLMALPLSAGEEEYNEAIRLIRAGNFKVAETLLRAVLRDEDSPRVRYALGICADRQNKTSEAVNHYRIALFHNVISAADPLTSEHAMRRLFELQPHLAPILNAANELELQAQKLEGNQKKFLMDAAKMLYNHALNPAERKADIEAENMPRVGGHSRHRADINVFKPRGIRKGIPEDAREFKGNFYKVYLEQISWHDARKKCEGLGGSLVTIGSDDEMNFVKTLASPSAYLWLGGYRIDGEWKWIDGTEWTVTNWGSGAAHSHPDAKFLGLRSIEGSYKKGFGWTAKAWPTYSYFRGFICKWSGKDR